MKGVFPSCIPAKARMNKRAGSQHMHVHHFSDYSALIIQAIQSRTGKLMPPEKYYVWNDMGVSWVTTAPRSYNAVKQLLELPFKPLNKRRIPHFQLLILSSKCQNAVRGTASHTMPFWLYFQCTHTNRILNGTWMVSFLSQYMWILGQTITLGATLMWVSKCNPGTTLWFAQWPENNTCQEDPLRMALHIMFSTVYSVRQQGNNLCYC